MSNVVKDIGAVSAYALAVEQGFVGTEAEWAKLQMQAAENARRAETAAGNSESSAQQAGAQAGAAAQSAANAKASETAASQSAANAKASETASSQSATAAAGSAAQAEAVLLSIPEEYDTVASNAAEALRIKAPAIVQTATGSVIAVSDASAMPLKGLKLCGRTTQDGTPTPETPVDLVSVGEAGSIAVGVCGKNLLPYPYSRDKYNTSGVTFQANADGAITINGTASANATFFEFATANVIKGQTYVIDGGLSAVDAANEKSNSFQMYCSGAIARYVLGSQPCTFTPEADGVIRLSITVYKGYAVNNLTYKPMIHLASIADDTYEPYNPAQTLTAQTPNGLAGVGGVCDEWDAGSGEIARRIKKLVLTGAESWAQNTTTPNVYTLRMLDIENGLHQKDDVYLLCTHYKAVRYNDRRDGTTYMYGGSLGNVMAFYDANISTLDAWKTHVAALYAAGTPITVMYASTDVQKTALTAEEIAAFRAVHANYPNTTVYNDAGAEMAVDYVADTKLYIDGKFNELAAALMNN